MKQHILSTALIAGALFAEGGIDMPMLNWMGREKAARATKDVVMKILREDKSLSASLRLCVKDELGVKGQLDKLFGAEP